jgi:hypothetical protein
LRALPPAPARSVLYCIWKDPWMGVSSETYIAAMLRELGWQVPPLVADDTRYPRFDWNDELLERIDAVLLSTEPYRFTEEHARALEEELGKPVVLVDGEMLSWYGSRALAGLRYLREVRDMLERSRAAFNNPDA